ncbi:hypothetical protein LTR37_017352 [Vermiconidia calcicola]|uniref:Uncharacterized protein n=1 Tax=Vermiconidia calcicola TaxID=1690605 RepID=A0ACC3ML59_9PEZI|nr:hypothetical protein LTR37_017352 [Vermiconidia calcicola]
MAREFSEVARRSNASTPTATGINNMNELLLTLLTYRHVVNMDHDQVLSSENTVPSSPSPAIFSGEQTRSSSPPSSPPGFPWEQQQLQNNATQSPSKSKETAFSVLGKRKALEPLAENARPVKKTAVASAPKPPTTQLSLLLGQEVQKKCKTCGMEYVPSSIEDRKLHDKYHKQNIEGYDVGKNFVQKARPHSVFGVARRGDSVCAIDCFDTPARKKRAQAVLEVVQRDLGAVEIPERDIWDARRAGVVVDGMPRYRSYLYTRGTKCVGFLLVQNIEEAFHVMEPVLSPDQSRRVEDKKGKIAKGSLGALQARQHAASEKQRQQEKQPIQLSSYPSRARLGISRIWTSPTHRHQNIATTLLDIALEHYEQLVDLDRACQIKAAKSGKHEVLVLRSTQIELGMEKGKLSDLVAFSQPTEAGTRLARRWSGRMFGWSVYVD